MNDCVTVHIAYVQHGFNSCGHLGVAACHRSPRGSEMKNFKKKTRHKHDSKDDLYENRDKALERVFALCEKYEGSDEQAEELDKALDVLAVAQIMLTLDFASGCLSS